MIEFISESWKTVFRWLTALSLVGLAVWISRHVGGIAFVFCLPFIVVATILVIPELSRPFTWMIDVLMGTTPPSGERPPIDLRLARSYVAQERLDDALAEYARVKKWHPKIAEPYEQTMILLARTGAKRARIDKVHRQGLRRLRSPDARNDLAAAHRKALDLCQQASAIVSGDTVRPA